VCLQPELDSMDLAHTDVPLGIGTLQQVDAQDEKIYLPVRANPNGVQPLLTAGIVTAFVQQVLTMVHAGVAQSTAWNIIGIPFLIGSIAFIFNILNARTRGDQVARYMAQMNAKLVGMSPGVSAAKKLRYVHAVAGGVGGLAIAGMAVVANCFDTYLSSRYGISAGCTGVLLMAGLAMSVLQKIEEIKVKKQVISKFGRERPVIPAGMPLVGSPTL